MLVDWNELIGISISATGIHQAMGKAKKAFLLAVLRWVLLIIPLILILPRIGGLGLDGIWLAFPIADTLAATIAIVMLHRTLQGAGIRLGLFRKPAALEAETDP